MSKIRANVVANTLGRGWSMLLGVGILPLYVRLLGAEAYGLIGLYATIAAICSLFDAGISASLGRELARTTAEEERGGNETGHLVRTAETLYLTIGFTLGGLVALCAPLIVTKWLNLQRVSPQEATQAVRLMGLMLVFQWSSGLYLAALSGLQRQVEANVITSVATSIRAVGSVIVLWKVSSSVTAFYWWQALSTAAYMFVIREAVWRAQGIGRGRSAFKWSVAHRVRKFAAGVTLMSFVSVLSSQLDKVVLTRLVPLQEFGYYSFAMSVAGAVTFFGQPVFAAIYPAMVEAFTRRDDARLTSLFHRGAQLASVATFAPAAVLCAFSPVVLRLWARSPSTAAGAAMLVSACLIGVALNGAAIMPYNLTLAAGRVRPAMIAAGSGALVSAATLAILAPRLGVMAGAIATALVNVTGLLVYARFAVTPLLPGQARRWLGTDLLLPMIGAGVVATVVRTATRSYTSLGSQTIALLLASFATLACAILFSPVAREELTIRIRSLRSMGSL